MALSKLLCFFVYFAGQMSDGMANSFFKFKQFTIHQERSAMRVSTDGVLLGAWSRVEKSNRILDIGIKSPTVHCCMDFTVWNAARWMSG